MPRITINPDSMSPRPTGVLKGKIIDMKQCSYSDDEVPKMKNLIDPRNICVLGFVILPDGHERSHTLWVPIRIGFKEGILNYKESAGVPVINKICESLGTTTMGFSPSGTFCDENDDPVQVNDISSVLLDEINKNPDFRVLVHIFKEKANDGKYYFRAGLNIHTVGEEKWAEKAAASDLDYQAKKNGDKVIVPNPRPDDDGSDDNVSNTGEGEDDEPRAAKPRAFSKRL